MNCQFCNFEKENQFGMCGECYRFPVSVPVIKTAKEKARETLTELFQDVLQVRLTDKQQDKVYDFVSEVLEAVYEEYEVKSKERW